MSAQSRRTPGNPLRRLLTRRLKSANPYPPRVNSGAQLAAVQRWLGNPDGGNLYPGQRDAIRAHDETCPGLGYAWLPRKSGYSDPGDIYDCEGNCDTLFHVEGVQVCFEECEEDLHYFCVCCRAKLSECPCKTKPPEPTA